MPVKTPTAPDGLPAEPGPRILRAAEAGAWRDGYRFLAAARDVSAKTEERAQNAYNAAYENGYAEGRAAGAIEASRLVRDTTLAVDRYLARLEKEVGHLALDIVRRVIGQIDVADLVARAASQVMTEFRHEKNLKVTVHPVAADRVSSALAALAPDDLPAVTVESDPAMDEGACILVSDFAVVNASIDAQLQAFETRLSPIRRGKTP
jgi:type III secretion protein L